METECELHFVMLRRDVISASSMPCGWLCVNPIVSLEMDRVAASVHRTFLIFTSFLLNQGVQGNVLDHQILLI